MISQTITPFNTRKYPPIASGSSFIYKVQFSDENDEILTPGAFQEIKLSIVNTNTGEIINDIENENLLSSARAAFDVDYTLSITIQPEETLISEDRLSRSLILEWVYGPSEMVGRHQAKFDIVRLSGD